ncbi:PIG-L family deacetylase [Candidatus Micrarchaeota archaeon]|nr:PIG-L family deacetylase [Candidatus Micrarchaeota archaeon]
MFDKKKILVLSPHPDDGELGASATIAKAIENGAGVYWATFSWCDESLDKEDNIKKEFNNAMKKLGVRSENIRNYDFKVRRFPEARQGILERLIELRKELQPELVVLPCSFDIHQDHHTINEEGVRAFKHSCLLGYEEPWNNLMGRLNFFVSVEDRHIMKKVEVVSQYKSQKGKRNYVTEEYLRSLAVVRGQQINQKYAEGFEMIRWIEK